MTKHVFHHTTVDTSKFEKDDKEGEHQQHRSTTANEGVECSWKLSIPPVMSYCLHPGLVRTNFVRDMPWYLYYPNKLFGIIMMMLQKTTRAGAYTTVYCAVMDATGTENDECYFVNSVLQPIASYALDEEDCRKLWELSSKVVSNV